MSNACVKFEERSLNPSKVIALTTKLWRGGPRGGPRGGGGFVADENIIFSKTYVSREYNDKWFPQSTKALGGGGGVYVASTDRDVPLIWVCFFSDLVRVWVGNSCSRYLHDPYFFIKWYFNSSSVPSVAFQLLSSVDLYNKLYGFITEWCLNVCLDPPGPRCVHKQHTKHWHRDSWYLYGSLICVCAKKIPYLHIVQALGCLIFGFQRHLPSDPVAWITPQDKGCAELE